MAAGSTKRGAIPVPKGNGGGFKLNVGRQSKKVSGKQGMHHHPQMKDLGRNMATMGGILGKRQGF